MQGQALARQLRGAARPQLPAQPRAGPLVAGSSRRRHSAALLLLSWPAGHWVPPWLAAAVGRLGATRPPLPWPSCQGRPAAGSRRGHPRPRRLLQ
eukprot:1020614-Lingulodinium_polyedra.AAC.1